MSAVLVKRHDRVVVVSLNRPQALNAIDASLGAELVRVGRDCADDEAVRAVVLGGAGRAFCSGADLTPGALPMVGASRGAAVRHLLETIFNPIIRTWALLPKPVVIAQNGIAAGGGVGLALSGDFLVMAESATQSQVFVPKLALVPDMGVTYLLPRAVGAARARALALLGTPLTAADARAWGLAHDVVPDAELAEYSLDLAARLAAGPLHAQAAAKALLGAEAAALDAALAAEAEAQARLADHADHLEGLAAFAERRPPAFG
jgi:2-(1,2-epoxy-1,2-dihydrophenyl)acetyl-CoA isomerase